MGLWNYLFGRRQTKPLQEREKARLRYLEEGISDAQTLKQAKRTLEICYDYINYLRKRGYNVRGTKKGSKSAYKRKLAILK